MMYRAEGPRDAAAIASLTEAAFRTAPHRDGKEAAIVAALREAGALHLSLLAVEGDRIVGHVAFSPVAVAGSDVGWFGLGPISVAPDLQRRGVGSSLIRRGLAELRGRGARGCVVLGDPAFYGRFGFRHEPRLTYAAAGAAFQALAFDGDPPAGEVSYARAFG